MRSYNAMMTRWRRMKMVGGALVLPVLIGIGLPNSQAQLRYSGGYVRIPRERSDAPRPTALQEGPASSSRDTSPSVSPDNDFGSPTYSRADRTTTTPTLPRPDNDFAYPSDYPTTTSVSRSYYAGGESERPVSLPAGVPPFGLSAAALPWKREGFKGYEELQETPRDSLLFSPRKYALEATPLPLGPSGRRLEIAVLIAYLPEHALLWVDGRLTRVRGQTRYLQSPPLPAGGKYSYTARVAWIEDGRWVSQTQKVPVQAGLIQAIFLRPSITPLASRQPATLYP